MIELYQELVPFTNEKTTNKVSQDNIYTNPIIMPLSFDVTSSYNTVETVLYIRNSDKQQWYKYVHICLLAPIEYAADPTVAATTFTPNPTVSDFATSPRLLFKENGNTKFALDTEYGIEETAQPIFNLAASAMDASIGHTMIPISGITSPTNYGISQTLSEVKDVRFSLGYDEVSELGWNSKARSVIIPAIGSSTAPNNSFIPVRMRITLNNKYGDMLTLRKFSLHIAYSECNPIQ